MYKFILALILMLTSPALAAGPFPTTGGTSSGIDTDGDLTREFNCDGTDCDIDPDDDATVEAFFRANSLFILEGSAADADVAAYGQFWVRNDAPNTPMFTDDAGTDFVIKDLIHWYWGQNGLSVANTGSCMITAFAAVGAQTCVPANAPKIGYLFDGAIYLRDLSCSINTITQSGTTTGDQIEFEVTIMDTEAGGYVDQLCTVTVSMDQATDTSEFVSETSNCDLLYTPTDEAAIAIRMNITDGDAGASALSFHCGLTVEDRE